MVVVGRWCWVTFSAGGVLLIWIIGGLGPTVLAIGAGGVLWTFFSHPYHLSFLSPSLKEPLNLKNQRVDMDGLCPRY